jgi:hypothetical protein
MNFTRIQKLILFFCEKQPCFLYFIEVVIQLHKSLKKINIKRFKILERKLKK